MGKRDLQTTEAAVRSFTFEKSDFRRKEVKKVPLRKRMTPAQISNNAERIVRINTKLWLRFHKAGGEKL